MDVIFFFVIKTLIRETIQKKTISLYGYTTNKGIRLAQGSMNKKIEYGGLIQT